MTRLLARDRSAHLGPAGLIYYAEPVPTQQSTTTALAPPAPYPYADTFAPHSLPGAPRVIHLDCDGVEVENTVWNDYFGLPNGTYAGLDMDGSPGTFSEAERDVVQDVWRRVSEDYAPFDIDVTTADPGLSALNRSDSGDQSYGMRVTISGSATVASVLCGGSCAGVAFLDVFNQAGSAAYHPAWVFSNPVDNDSIQIAETASHEVGHAYHSGPRPSR